MTRPYQVESALHRLELAALEYVAARSQPIAERLLLATVELDRACHALVVATDDTGTVCMPSSRPTARERIEIGLDELRDAVAERLCVGCRNMVVNGDPLSERCRNCEVLSLAGVM